MKGQCATAAFVSNESNDYIVRNGKAKDALKAAPEGMPTVAAMIPFCAQKYPNARMFGTRQIIARDMVTDAKTGRQLEKLALGEYQWQTYSEVNARVQNFGSGLRRAGLTSGATLTIYMNTCAEWQIAAHAAFQMTSPVVTIYATLGEEAQVHGMNETETTHIVTEASLLAQLRRVAKQTPALTTIIYMGTANEKDLEGFPEGMRLLKYADVEADGKANPSTPEKTPTASDLAVIMYTSGSTGMPKGVLLTHGNIVAGVQGLRDSLPNMSSGEDFYLAFLPLAHILALTAELFFMSWGCSIGYGSPTTLTETSPRLKQGSKGDIATLRPTYMACVPTIIDRIRQGVLGKINAASPTVQKLFWKGFAAKGKAFEANGGLLNSATIGFWDRLVFNKIKAALGGRMKGLVSGGAPLSTDSQRFMAVCFGIPVIQGYGLTETCAMAAVGDVFSRGVYGRVGIPETCVQYKLIDWEEGGYRVADKDNKDIGAARGEICIAGPCLAQGYYKLPEKTAEDFKTDVHGVTWFHTGDIGMVHGDGTLQIIDRKKDLVKLQQGEYVSLGKVEAALAAAPGVEQICVHADPFHAFAIALVVPQKSALLEQLAAAGINTDRPWEEVCGDAAVVKHVLGGIEGTGRQARLARFEVPQKIVLMADMWTPESGLVTASLKLQRAQIYKRFADLIAATYDK